MLDQRVIPRHRNVCYSNLALVPPAQLDALGPQILDQQHALRFLACRLEDHVVVFRLLDGQQLHLRFSSLDDHG